MHRGASLNNSADLVTTETPPLHINLFIFNILFHKRKCKFIIPSRGTEGNGQREPGGEDSCGKGCTDPIQAVYVCIFLDGQLNPRRTEAAAQRIADGAEI